MTDEQTKAIANVTLINSGIISRLAAAYVILVEQVLPLLPEKGQALALLSDLEQLQAITADLQPDLDRARKELGLE